MEFPIVQALKSILGFVDPPSTPLGAGGGIYKLGNLLLGDYRRFATSDSDAKSVFSYLWGIDENCGQAKGESRVKDLLGLKCIVLLEVDHVQTESIQRVPKLAEYARHLGAVDWALAFRLASQRISGTEAANRPQIIILNLDGNSASVGTNGFDVGSLATEDVHYFAGGLILDGLDSFAATLPKLQTAAKNKQAGGQTLERLARQWMASLTDAGDASDAIGRSHYLNNLLGPLALAVQLCAGNTTGGLRDQATQEVSDAFKDTMGRRGLMRAIEWMRPDSAPVAQNRIPVLANRERELRILVLDDQIQDGWMPILAKVLGVTYKAVELDDDNFAQVGSNDDKSLTLWVADHPRVLHDVLLSTSKNPQGLPSQTRFSANVESHTPPAFDEILLLDLRLFGHPSKKHDQEICDDWVSKKLGERWPANDPHDADRLTGLARLISKHDYAFPVVIWSSTGQRHIVEKLRPLQNIVTTLKKPRFDMYGSNAGGFIDDFAEAVTTAQRLNTARNWLRDELQTRCDLQLATPLHKNILEQVNSNKQTAVFVHLDESGQTIDTSFKHGGIAVIVSTAEEKLAKNWWEKIWSSFITVLSPDPNGPECILKTTIGTDCLKPISGIELKSFFEYDKNKNKNCESNAVSYLPKFAGQLSATEKAHQCQISVVYLASLDEYTNQHKFIDWRHIGAVQELLTALIASIAVEGKPLLVRLEIDGRSLPVPDEGDKRKLWYNADELNHMVEKKYGKDTSRSVTSTVAHCLTSIVNSRINGLFSDLLFVGAKSAGNKMSDDTASTVLHTISDFVPRMAFRSKTSFGSHDENNPDGNFGVTGNLLHSVRSPNNRLLGQLLDIYLDSKNASCQGLLIAIHQVLKPGSQVQVNSFASVVLSRLSLIINNKLTPEEFWSFAKLFQR